jgi:glucose-1-phosphate cytidylyltransferase
MLERLGENPAVGIAQVMRVLEKEPFHRLAADRQLSVYEHQGFWRAMDTFKEAQELNMLWDEGAPWKTWSP